MTAAGYLICTDLDRTLIPNGPAAESPAAADCFASLASHDEITLAFVSGRHRTLVDDAIREFDLPSPDFVIGDVGTTLYRFGPSGDWRLEHAWEDRFAEDWSGHIAADLLPLLNGVDGLRAQEPEKQNRFKLSYYLDPDRWSDELAASIRKRLAAADVDARLIWSIDDLTGKGLLDILPRRASKRHAVEALMEVSGFTLENTVFCGDSGNDLEVLASPIPAVLVANARSEVKRQALELAEASGCSNALYVAHGGFLGMNGNYRGGILEGIAHYHPALGALVETGSAGMRIET